MSRHPLLPKQYTDSNTQSAILFALGPHKINDRADIANPQLKWNLTQAWKDSEELLAGAQWTVLSALGEEYEIAADSENEIEALNPMIAGIVAYEILNPESGISLKRVEHRKGGEMALIISGDVVQKLKKLLPEPPVSDVIGSGKRWWSMLNWIKR
jgi:hypothetical protein